MPFWILGYHKFNLIKYFILFPKFKFPILSTKKISEVSGFECSSMSEISVDQWSL